MTAAPEQPASPALRPPLDGLRILELGHFVAAPFATRLLADLGATVIKVEPLQGDPVRDWGAKVDGRSLWWSMHGRNKYCVAVDLKSDAGRQVVLDIVGTCDAVVENFRPGGLARLGLGPEALRAVRPDIVIAQISGYGQSGPYRDMPAFGVIGEAMGGLRYLTNHPPETSDLPPVRVGVSIGNSIAGLYAAFGLVAALWQRDRAGGDKMGRTLDVALTESILSLMEGMLPEYGALGRVKQPTGGAIATAAPSNSYPTSDGGWLLIAANSEPLFARLTKVMQRPDLLADARFSTNALRVQHAALLDREIAGWASLLPAAELLARLEAAQVPGCRVFTAADIADDPQYRARNMVRPVADPHFGTTLQAGVVPHFTDSPDTIRWAGPEIGQHSSEVLGNIGYPAERIARLRAQGCIA